jgi:hypothetical protein
MDCVRRAWLTLGSLSVDLESTTAGYFCSSLDLGYPQVRDVTSSNPDRDGVQDRTRYMGGRVVSADITALAGAGARIDAVASTFAPFMVPSARPTLHYILDRPGAAERTLTVRGSGYSWPVEGPFQRDIQLQWLAADPVARDATIKTATAYAGSSSSPGRLYPLTFNRIYPAGGGNRTTGVLVSAGDVPIRPMLRIYGPITSPSVQFQNVASGGVIIQPGGRIDFAAGFVIGSGQYVDVDTANKTAWLNGDPTQSVLASINWQSSQWPVVNPQPPATSPGLMSLVGTSTTGITQVLATWQDGYLS